jgi:hypothetical protein
MIGFLRWLGIAALVLLLTGCIKLDQTLTLNKDGSGTLDIRYGMAEQTIAQLEAMERMSQQDGADSDADAEEGSPFDFDEAEVREKFEKEKPEGVELVSAASEVVDGWKYMKMRLSFEDLEALKRTEFFEDSDLSIRRDDNGNYVLTQKTGADDAGIAGAPGGGDGEDAMAEAMMEQMAAMFAGLRIATSVVAPSEILESNATSVEGNKATWVFDIEEDPTVLSKLNGMDLKMVFSGDGVDLPEVDR